MNIITDINFYLLKILIAIVLTIFAIDSRIYVDRSYQKKIQQECEFFLLAVFSFEPVEKMSKY